MSTSAESGRSGPTPGPAGTFVLRARPYGDAVAAGLVDLLQAEYVVRYGGPDETPMDAAEFAPPDGYFVIGELDGVAVACGGWRAYAPGAAELKRMFVVAAARRRGLARLVLADLERTAAAAGITSMVLETGSAQPEAVEMYTRAGYRPVPKFGHYRDSPLSISLSKPLLGE